MKNYIEAEIKKRRDEVLFLKEKIKIHREHSPVRSRLMRNGLKEKFEAIKLKYEYFNSIIDYILSTLRQFLALSVTGHLGLMAIPSAVLGDISSVQHILLIMIFWLVASIIVLLIIKIIWGKRITSIIDNVVDLQGHITHLDDECQKFIEEFLRDLAECEAEIEEIEKRS